MKNYFFILRTFNDIDHITPLIWKYAEKGNNIHVLLNSKMDYENDPRIQLIRNYKNVKIFYEPDKIHDYFSFTQGTEESSIVLFFKKLYFLTLNPNRFLGKVFYKFFLNCKKEYEFLKEKKIDAIFVEWSPPYQRGYRFIKFLIAAKGSGLPVICLPHGLNIYLNSDIHQNFYKNIIKGKLLNQSEFNIYYDFLFVQSKYHAKHFNSFGVQRNKIIVAGSLRFCDEWIKIHKTFTPKFESKIKVNNKIKIVFMLPHWIYNVDKQKTLTLIKKISSINNVVVIIKNHTRADTGLFPKNESISNNVEITSSVSSSSLIDWSDIVVNFGSSIGIEAILKNKKLVCPVYLQQNKLLYEFSHLTTTTNNEDETIDVIKNFKNSSDNRTSKAEDDQLIQNTVLPPGLSRDVIKHYEDKIEEILNYKIYNG